MTFLSDRGRLARGAAALAVLLALPVPAPASAPSGKTFGFEVPAPPEYEAVGLDNLRLEMRKAGGDPEAFFDPARLARLSVSAPDGTRAESALVVFRRDFPPLLLIRTKGVAGRYTVRAEEADQPGNLLAPRAGLKRVAGLDAAPYRLPAPDGGLALGADDFAKSKGIAKVADDDSFFLDAVRFDDDARIDCEVTLEKPLQARLLAYSRNPDDFRNFVWVEVDGRRIKVGGNKDRPPTFYWQGGTVVDLPAGLHALRLFPSKPKAADRPELALGRLVLTADRKAPGAPGFSEELDALQAAGFGVYRPERLPAPVAAGRGADPFRAVVAPDKTYPDLSYMSGEVDRHGFLHADGTGFRYDDGTAVPRIWGCNLEYTPWYEAVHGDRLGGDFADRLLSRIKAMGYDTVRYMPMTLPFVPEYNQNNIAGPLLSTKPLKFAGFFLDDFQRLVAGCHRRDLHLFYTLWNDNGCFTDLGTGRADRSFLVFFHPEAMARLKEETRLLLTTPNPYRGNVAPVDDPTLSIVEVENERNFVEMWKKDAPVDWRTLPPDAREILYARWAAFLRRKYPSLDALRRNYAPGTVALRPGFGEEKGLAAVEFPPVWDVKQWGGDSGGLRVGFDDLRVTSASFGKDKRSNPAVSDGLEFTYVLYRDFLAEMVRFLKADLGYKGVVYANGPDTELYYSQRRALVEAGDAVSGGTGYWNKEGFGFLRELGWLAPLVYASNNDKPVISREYGPNLVFPNCWWGGLISACVQQYLGMPYLCNFTLGLVTQRASDYLYPSDTLDPARHINLDQDGYVYSHFANLAAAIALRADELKTPAFRVDIGLPYDNTFYAASFRGYNRLTIQNYVPFLYAPTRVRVFGDTYDGTADLVVNEPSLPAGDYAAAKRLFLLRPHSTLDRYGHDASAWLDGKAFQAGGLFDAPEEAAAFHDALTRAGFAVPVARDEMGKVWRSAGRELEIDTGALTFRADLPGYGAFIGSLENGAGKMPRQFRAAGRGPAWVFSGAYGPEGRNAVLFGVLDGTVDLQPGRPLDYLFAGTRRLVVRRGERTLLEVTAPMTIQAALKTEGGADVAQASTLYLSFFRPRSCVSPASIALGVGKVAAIDACDADGNPFGAVPFETRDGLVRFENPWRDGARISYFRIRVQPRAAADRP